nr:lysylphosphatidylglycerol synthase transmembrane domain-containing protein [Pseudoclavibacter sp. Marseille-Q3772]
MTNPVSNSKDRSEQAAVTAEQAGSSKRGVAATIVAVLRSKPVRYAFVVIALAGATWALVSVWPSVMDAVQKLPWWVSLVSLAIGIVYVVLTMLSWRAVLVGLGTDLPIGAAGRLFFVSQLGKFVPGGVWNYLAVVEMGTAHQIPRRRSLSAMVVSILISIVTAGMLAIPGIVLTGALPQPWTTVALVCIPLVACLLIPAVLNRLIEFALRVTKRPPLESPLQARHIVASSSWALGGWILSGLMIWMLAIQLGVPASFESLLLVAGGYSLSWAVGFVVFFMPAGIGVREVVLAAMLQGVLDTGELVLIVLLARVISTLADVILGVSALIASRASASSEVDPAVEERPLS